MEENKNTAVNTNGNAGATDPAGANAGTQKTFTQEEVNNIVQGRLARERAKNEPTPLELREKELTARETAMSCREYVAEKGYPKELLDLFDTSNVEEFKKKTDKLHELFEIIPKAQITRQIIGTGFQRGDQLDTGSLIAQAFEMR